MTTKAKGAHTETLKQMNRRHAAEFKQEIESGHYHHEQPASTTGREAADNDLLDSQEFYELMQAYRHAPLQDRTAAANAYESVKNFIREEAAVGLYEQNERLREALLELKCRAEFALTTPGFIRGRDELRRAIEAIRPDDVFDAALNHAEQGEGS